MCEIRWLGHASWEITTGDGKRIYLDPWLDANPACPIKLSEIDRADIVCVSHGHRDHIGDSLDIVKKTGARLICTPEIGFYAASKGIEFDRGSYPLNIGGSVRLGGVTVHMTAAAHTTELYGEEWLKESRVLPGSGAVGFVLEEAGVSIYYAGDTGLFGDMRLIGELYNPQVALLPIGGKYNMGPRLAAFAAQLIRPQVLVPMHYDTYPAIEQDLGEFEKLVRALAPGIRVVSPNPGESFSFP